MAELSPMMKQYFRIKENYPDAILFFRMGDFYEMFFEDAKTASRELELVLTGRDCGQEERAPMCGVPHHSADNYIARLVSRGYKVAICEQVEDPAKAKGIVKRDVIRIITPGTVIESNMLSEGKNNYLGCAVMHGNRAGLCFVDISTGNFHATEVEDSRTAQAVINEFSRFEPKEVIINSEVAANSEIRSFIVERLDCIVNLEEDAVFALDACKGELLSHFGTSNLADIGVPDSELAIIAAGRAIAYLKNTHKTDLANLRTLDYYENAQFMRLDVSARRNLELTETMRNKEKRGSLLWVLDQTKTAMGKRMLRTWLEQPLVQVSAIEKRLNAVEELHGNVVLRSDVSETLGGIFDLERLLTRIVYGTANAKELRALAQALCILPKLIAVLAPCRTELLRLCREQIDPLEDVLELIQRSIVDEPPFTLREGGLIRDGFSPELDELNEIMRNGTGYLADIERRERERTGIGKLKIGYNKVYGYYIEITNFFKDLVPEDYIRKQTLTNCERYITQELKELEGKVLGAKERAVQLEYELFCVVRDSVSEQFARIQATAHAIAQLDAVYSLAAVAAVNNYIRPSVNAGDAIVIREGRHPVVELVLKGAPFVPNDTHLDGGENRLAIITGPNMAGKSTYMRQVAVITLMAQIGSFVPAKSAEIGVVDSIFTRVGASDDLASGQSTFMVEMNEVASILENATNRSLILYDEIGRGTSTFDGMSIARAVLEYTANQKKLGAKALFATHYHELTALEGETRGVKNYNIAVKKRGDEITFLRRIVRGGADDSYGIDVAKLAGVPNSVVRRAKEILKELEAEQPKAAVVLEPEPENDMQISFLSGAKDELIEKLKRLDANTLTPIEAMSTLYELTQQAKDLQE